jgi:hypothetical protein
MGNVKDSCKYILAQKGSSDWKIVLGNHASPSEIHAAEELQYFLKEISGAALPIVKDDLNKSKHEIIVGDSEQLAQLRIKVDWNKLGDEGFIINTVDECLVIAGGKLRGTLYGVYTFLENYLGCRWFSSKVSSIPKKDTVEIPSIEVEQVPALEYRETYYYDSFDGDWAARNKSNGHFQRLEAKHGKKVKYSHFVHTFDHLVPVKEYFDTHPEYFSEVDGKRISERTQLCLTNPEVLKLAIAKVKQWIKEDPEATIISVSQNDWYNPCQCEKCKAVDAEEDSYSGTLIRFVNAISEAIEKDYPHVAIDTLAYQYTRKAPRLVKPRKNVIVRLCSIECCFSHPLETCDVMASFKNRKESGASFKKDLEDWSKISDRLYIWDYVTNFAHYVMPFPNLEVLKPNVNFFIKNSVKGVFEEGNYAVGGNGEFAELRAYILAKVLWDPDYDTDLAINEFLTGYYGMAAAPIREYIDILHKKVKDENIHVGIYYPPTSPYLSPDIIDKSVELFDRAERLAENEEVLQRVRTARLPLRYVQLSNMDVGEPNRKALIEEFFSDLSSIGTTQIKESRTLEYAQQLMEEGKIDRYNV